MPLLLIFSIQSSTIYFGVTFSLFKLLLFSHHFHISHLILGLDWNPELTITIQEYLFDFLHRHWFSSLFPSSCYDVVVGCNWVYFLSFTSIQFSRSVVSDSLWPHESQHARPPCPSPTPGVHSDSCPSSHWCHLAISSSIVPFSSCPQSLPASESFPMSQLFPWGGQSTGVSALTSFLPKKSQDGSPSEWTGWISLQSKGLSRVFSNITVQKHQFFGTQLSSQSNSHIHTWLQEKP